jgi:hypothetical protein
VLASYSGGRRGGGGSLARTDAQPYLLLCEKGICRPELVEMEMAALSANVGYTECGNHKHCE